MAFIFGKNIVDKDERYDGLNYFKEFVEASLAQIQKMKELSKINEPSTSENILRQMKSFFNDLKQRGHEYNIKVSILSQGLYGYCVIQYIRFQLSVSTDKNLSEITKGAFLQQIKNGRFGKFRQAFKAWDGFEDIWGGGFELFSYASANKASAILNVRGVIRIPALKELSIIESYKYSGTMIFRIKNKLTQKEYKEIKDLFRYSYGYVVHNFEPRQHADNFMKVFYNQNEEGENIIMNLTSSLATSLMLLHIGDPVELVESPEIYHEISSTLNWWQEEHGESLGFYPHDSLFHSYEPKIHLLSGMLVDSSDMYTFPISNLDDFIDVLSEFDTYYSEVSYESLDDAIIRYLYEQENGYRSELDELLEGNTPLGFSEDKTITLSNSDRVISQLDASYFDDVEDSGVNVKRVLLVEYRNPDTLKEITPNTAGELCVGRQGMSYMDGIRNGSQRHFGVLAQTDEGLHVMYHTHYQGDNWANAKFTNHYNSEGYSSQKEGKNPHGQILRQAEVILQQVIKNPRLQG